MKHILIMANLQSLLLDGDIESNPGPRPQKVFKSTLVEVVLGPVKLASFVTHVKLGFTLTVLMIFGYLIQPSMILAEVTRLGNVTIVDLRIFHRGFLIQLFWMNQVLTATHPLLHLASQLIPPVLAILVLPTWFSTNQVLPN